jgi:hypothetical protein
MSNVLIGIIGVILFIGLALAGALFLGPRFQESTNNSRGAAVIQAVSQISNAANMYRVQEGLAVVSNANIDTILRANGYPKSVPANPTSDVYVPLMTTAAGVRNATAPADYGVMQLTDNAASVCAAIAKQSGQTLLADGSAPEASTALPTATNGCVKMTAGLGSALTSGGYYAFSRI